MGWVQCRSAKLLDRMATVTGLNDMGRKRLGLELPEGELERFRALTLLRWVALRVGARRSKVDKQAFGQPVPWVGVGKAKVPVLVERVPGHNEHWVDSLGIPSHWPSLQAQLERSLKGEKDPWRAAQTHLVIVRTGLVQYERRFRELSV